MDAYETILQGIAIRARVDASKSLKAGTLAPNPYKRLDYRELWEKEFNMHRVQKTALAVGISDLTDVPKLVGKRVRTLKPLFNMHNALRGLPCEDPAGMEGTIMREYGKLIVRFDDGVTWSDYTTYGYEFVTANQQPESEA